MFTTLGGTMAILAAAVVTAWFSLASQGAGGRSPYIGTLMAGELAMFLTAAAVVQAAAADGAAPGPAPAHLGVPVRARGGDVLPVHRAGDPGHRACARLVAVAVPAPGDRVPCPRRASSMYRGEHHPTDMLASLLFAALWVPAATLLIRPNSAAGAGPGQSTSSDSASMRAASSAAVAGRAA